MPFWEIYTKTYIYHSKVLNSMTFIPKIKAGISKTGYVAKNILTDKKFWIYGGAIGVALNIGCAIKGMPNTARMINDAYQGLTEHGINITQWDWDTAKYLLFGETTLLSRVGDIAIAYGSLKSDFVHGWFLENPRLHKRFAAAYWVVDKIDATPRVIKRGISGLEKVFNSSPHDL